MATDLSSRYGDVLSRSAEALAGPHPRLRLGVSGRTLLRGGVLALVFFCGFAWGVLAGAEGERATIEIERTLFQAARLQSM